VELLPPGHPLSFFDSPRLMSPTFVRVRHPPLPGSFPPEDFFTGSAGAPPRLWNLRTPFLVHRAVHPEAFSAVFPPLPGFHVTPNVSPEGPRTLIFFFRLRGPEGPWFSLIFQRKGSLCLLKKGIAVITPTFFQSLLFRRTLRE